MADKVKVLTFPDTDEGAQLFGHTFGAYLNARTGWDDPQKIRRGANILDKRDEISEVEETEGGGENYSLIRGEGDQHLKLTIPEYNLFRETVKSFSWPPALAREAQDVLEFIDSAEDGEVPIEGEDE